MKTKLFLIALLISVWSCNQEDDDSGSSYMIRIYKTNGDYFNKINIWANFNHSIQLDTSIFLSIQGGDTVCHPRWRLEQGYVAASAESSPLDWYTDVTFSEILSYNKQTNKPFPLDSLLKRVIDKDPFIEYYADSKKLFGRMPKQIEEINEIIRNGELEKYFKRVK
jgi:hypothetical protein